MEALQCDLGSTPAAFARRTGPHRAGLALVLLLAGLFFFYGLSKPDLTDHEPMRARIGREMLATGNWLVPTYFGQPELVKPPGMYAAIAAASAVWGEVTHFTARLPSALAALFTVLLLYWFTSRSFHPQAGLVAALSLTASWVGVEEATMAEIDMLLTATVVAALLCVERGETGEERERHWIPIGYVCLAAGFLTKGWAALLFFYGTLLPYLGIRRRWGRLASGPHLAGIGLFALLVGSWIAAVVAQTGFVALWTDARVEISSRFTDENWIANVAETMFYPLRILIAFLPWSGYALLTLNARFHATWQGRQRDYLVWLHCWIWPNLLLWSLLPDQETRYALPVVPAMAMLAGVSWHSWLSGKGQQNFPAWHRAVTVCTFLGMLGSLAVGSRTAWREAPDHRVLLASLAAVTVCLALGGIGSLKSSLRWLPLGCLLGIWIAAKVAVAEVMAPQRAQRDSWRLAAEKVQRIVAPERAIHFSTEPPDNFQFYFEGPIRPERDPSHAAQWDQPSLWLVSAKSRRAWPVLQDAQIVTRVACNDGREMLLLEVVPTPAAVRAQRPKLFHPSRPARDTRGGHSPGPLTSRSDGPSSPPRTPR